MGGAVLGASVVLGLTALSSGPIASRLFVLCGLAGGLVAGGSALQALVTVGGSYGARLGFGWAALLFALGTAAVPLALTRRPRLAASRSWQAVHWRR